MNYANLPGCLNLLQILAPGRVNDVLAPVKLQESAATKNGVTHYRPYYVAARLLQQSFQDQTFSAIPDHELTGLQPIVTSYLQEQQAIDLTQGWEVPAAYSVEAAIAGRIVRMGLDCA